MIPQVNEYQVVAVTLDSERGLQGFTAKIVTPDWDDNPYDVCFFEALHEAETVCATLNDAVAECERLILGPRERASISLINLGSPCGRFAK